MDIRVTIEMGELDERFSVTSRPYKSVTEAFCDVAPAAEKHRELIRDINHKKYMNKGEYLYIGWAPRL